MEEKGGLLQIRSGRTVKAPWGTAGGMDGSNSQNILNPGTPEERKLRGLETFDVPGNTVFLHVTPGAGGFGPPAEREPALVARDVRDGKVSVQRARDIYRVVVSDRGVIDAEATARLRGAQR